MRTATANQRRLRPTLALLSLAPFGCFAAELPYGFGGIDVGASWSDIESLHAYQDLSPPTTDEAQYLVNCGRRTLWTATESGELLRSLNDNVVTELSHATALEPGTDLFETADIIIQAHDQPDAASLGDSLGSVTIIPSAVNYITLEYHDAGAVIFSFSGAQLWQ